VAFVGDCLINGVRSCQPFGLLLVSTLAVGVRCSCYFGFEDGSNGQNPRARLDGEIHLVHYLGVRIVFIVVLQAQHEDLRSFVLRPILHGLRLYLRQQYVAAHAAVDIRIIGDEA